MAELIAQNEDKDDDLFMQGVAQFAQAALMPAALLLTGYVAYQGLINFGTGVDGLRDRYSQTPFGRYTDRFGENIRRTHPLYRFFVWGFGGENPPIIPEQTQDQIDRAQDKAESLLEKLKNAIPDVPNVGGSGSDPSPPGTTNENRGGGDGF